MANLENDLEIILLVLVSTLIASGGFWTWMTNRREKNSATTKLLMGLAHDTILKRGDAYIRRGWITSEEYNDLVQYLVGPYMELGGNGMAERLMGEIKKLPITNPHDTQHFRASKESHVQLRINHPDQSGVAYD